MSNPFKVVVTDFVEEPATFEREILGEIAEVKTFQAMGEDNLVGKVEDADAIMLYHYVTITRPTIERLTNCRLIVRCGVGYDNIDHVFARERGIDVANVPDYGSEEVADSAIGMALALARGFHFLNNRLRDDTSAPWSYELAKPLRRLRGETFGIVGVGRIGTATALRAKALGMEVVYHDPYAPDGRDKALGIRRVEDLDDLLRQSRILSLHCPGTDETKKLIDDRALSLMPEGSFLVNTARGTVTDGEAIAKALQSGKLAGAAVDVLPQEPPSEDTPLLQAWRDPDHPAHHRLILNPHAAFYSEEGIDDMRIKGSENCLRALKGLPPRNVVN